MSTFQGLEMSKRALFAQQGALYTTGHNIANVNTKGYSRQRVNFETTTPFPQPARMMPGGAGQIGTGVDIGVIDRIRNKFLDSQYRTETSSMGYWETRQDALSRMEGLLNEPSDNGLQKTMDQFWQSLQDLADNPEDDGPRSVVAQRGLAVAETFSHLSKKLEMIREDLKEEIDQSEKDINKLLNGINEINKQIKKIEPHGQLANDLYDERDRLLDELSEYVNIKVTYEDSSDSALDIADGIIEIELLDEKGESIINDGKDRVQLLTQYDTELSKIEDRFEITEINDGDALTGINVKGVRDKEGDLQVYSADFDAGLKKTGSLSALMESYGYVDDSDGDVKGDYPETLQDLDNMAAAFADKFNEVHSKGKDLNGKDESDGDDFVKHFFITNDNNQPVRADFNAGNITVNEKILNDGSFIAAAATKDEKGESLGGQNGENALNLAELFKVDISIGEEVTTVRKFYNNIVGGIGVEGQEAKRNVANTEILKNQVDNSRQSTSAVSLDEEIANLVKFQHAYNAAARNMTTVDEMIDRIINQMGLVGR